MINGATTLAYEKKRYDSAKNVYPNENTGFFNGARGRAHRQKGSVKPKAS